MSLFKAASTVSLLTLVSRITGLVRELLIASTFGASAMTDAFNVAFRIPNLFRRLFAEGAFNSAFVPIFAGKVEAEGLASARAIAQDVYAAMLAWMLFFCALCMAFMPWLIYLFAWGFHATPQKMALVIGLTQLCFPYLLFMTLTALQGGVLNSLNRFTAAAAAPILLNIVLILSNAVAWFIGSGNSALTGYIFAGGVTLSGLAQYALLAIACKRAGLAFLPKLPRLTPEVKQVFWRSLPGIFSGGVMQINLLIATSLASGIQHANSYLYYADRLYQLPLGVIGVAIGVVLLPTLSRRLRAGDEAGALDAKNRALEFSLFLTLPATMALMVIGIPILHTVFEHGAFKSADTYAVAPAVAAFALGLPAYSLTKVFQPGFYARGDTRTPMRFAIISVLVNIVGSITLSYFMSYVGIALATSLAAWLNAGQLYFRLRKLDHFAFDEEAANRIVLMLHATMIMAGTLAASWILMAGWFAAGASHWRTIPGLAVLVALGVVSYFGASHLTGAWRFSELKAALKRN